MSSRSSSSSTSNSNSKANSSRVVSRGRGKVGSEAAVNQPIDEFETMDSEQLQEKLREYKALLDEKRRQRNYFQLERDQISEFHDIAAEEVAKSESHIRNLETQMERMQDIHRNSIRIYLQKVIHLEYEHGNNTSSLSALHASEVRSLDAQHVSLKQSLLQNKLSLRQALTRSDNTNEDEIRRLKEIERKEMHKLREQFERNHLELSGAYDARLQQLKDDLELRRKMEIHEIQERKNRHINDLMINHEKNFSLMRTYYNSITQDNLDLIRELNNEIEDLKVAHAQNEKAMEQIEKKNQSLSEPLALAEAKVKALKHKLQNYQKDKESLRHARARLIVLDEQYKSMQIEHQHALERFAQMESERDYLYNSFSDTIASMKKKASVKNVALEKILDEYKDQFSVKKAQFSAVLRASNLDPIVLQNVTRKLDDVVSSKDSQISELQYELAKATKAHNDLVRVYEAKLRQMGIPREELGLEPLIGDTNTAPADLLVN